MKFKLKYLTSLLLFALTACGNGKGGYVGTYSFLMGKPRGDHFSIWLELTDVHAEKPVEPFVRITNAPENLKIGETYQLTWSTIGGQEGDKVTFTCEDEKILTISDSGLITAKQEGQTNIYAIYNYAIDTALIKVSNQDTVSGQKLPDLEPENVVYDYYAFSFAIESTMPSSEEGGGSKNSFFQINGGYYVNESETSPDKGKISIDVFTYTEEGEQEVILPAKVLDGIITLFYTGSSIKITLPVSLNDAYKDIISWWEKEEKDPTSKHVTLELVKD